MMCIVYKINYILGNGIIHFSCHWQNYVKKIDFDENEFKLIFTYLYKYTLHTSKAIK